MFNTVTGYLGDDVSDYPHSACRFPNPIDNTAPDAVGRDALGIGRAVQTEGDVTSG